MSSCKQTELSQMRSKSDLIDQLIYQALWNEVRDAEPSPQVWENIYQQLTATDTVRSGRYPVALLSLLGNRLVMMFNEFLYDRSWETRMAVYRVPTYRVPIFCADILFLTA